MNRTYCQMITGGVLLAITGIANALPIQVNYNNINAATTEDFESFASDQGTTQSFNGFTATVSAGNLFVTGSSTFCETSPDKCLTNQNSSTDTRTFNGFASGTNFFGFDFTPIADLDPSPTTNVDQFQVTVIGASGTDTFSISGNGLFGFGDATGLTSVSLVNLGDSDAQGFSNWGMDDVITGVSLQDTGSTPTIPIPGTLPVFALGLFGLGVLRWRKRATRG